MQFVLRRKTIVPLIFWCNKIQVIHHSCTVHLTIYTMLKDLWTDGLICAFEYIRSHRSHTKSSSKDHASIHDIRNVHKNLEPTIDQWTALGRSDPSRSTPPERSSVSDDPGHISAYNCEKATEDLPGSHWVPIGWSRISELILTVQASDVWSKQLMDFSSEEDDVTVADVASPYWERPVGPTWWCHVAADHLYIKSWLRKAPWLHPAVSTALLDESRLISERMKHLFYEVPVRVAGGLLFELLGQSAGDPYIDEDDIPVVLRSWQAQNFLVTALHVKGSASNINVLGIAEVQELLAAGCYNIPRSIHEIVAHLTCRLARWDDRLFRKTIFGAADEIELMFMNRRTQEDMHLFSIILNQEIRKLSTQVIRVKWSLHAREEIVFELLQHLRGNTTWALLEGIRRSTRQMIEEQEAVRGRLFTIQDVMQSTVRAWLQDRSLTVTHNLGVFGGCGLVLSIVTGLFGINVDGIPGSDDSPYAFTLFTCLLVLAGIVLIAIGLLYLGLKKPVIKEDVEVRKLELQEVVRMFQHEAESHAQVRKSVARRNVPPTAADLLPDGTSYVLVGR